MHKITKCLLLIIFLMIVVGCQPSEADKAKAYSEEVTKLVTEKGYTVEEIMALQNGQRVDKEYDNEVLERFGKVLVYEYSIQRRYKDTVEVRNHNSGEVSKKEFNVLNDEKETSIFTPDAFQAEKLSYYSDVQDDEKPVITHIGNYVADAFYEEGDYTKRRYLCIPNLEASSYPVEDDAPTYMDGMDLKKIIDNSDYQDKWYRIIGNEAGDTNGKQLMFPLIVEDK